MCLLASRTERYRLPHPMCKKDVKGQIPPLIVSSAFLAFAPGSHMHADPGSRSLQVLHVKTSARTFPTQIKFIPMISAVATAWSPI